MLREQQDRLAVVLVRARNPANIGAVARAMHDFGFAHLRVVNEFPVPFAAAKSAVDASSVLAAAFEAPTVAEAVADCTLIFGTTAVGSRQLEHPLYTLAQATTLIQQTLATQPEAKVALLFGSEKTGLSNDELSHCHALLTIPMNTATADRHLSMNLGQAAAVCLYALSQASDAPPLSFRSEAKEPASASPEIAPTHQATAGDLTRLHTLLTETLDRSGYARRHTANVRPATLRRLVLRMANTPDDAAVWSGVLRQFLHVLNSSDKSSDNTTDNKTAPTE